MKKEKSCGAIIFNNNKILVIQQTSNFYGFPKGHMEKGETEIETAIREIKEETNIDVKILDKYRYSISYIVHETIDKESVFYLAVPTTFDIQKQESEINNIEWIDIDKVYDKLTFDNSKEMWLKAKKDIEELYEDNIR